MTDKAQEFDELVMKQSRRDTKGCKCLEAMLEGYRMRYYRDDGCMYRETESHQSEKKEDGTDRE